MNPELVQAKTIFLNALEVPTAERAAYVQAQCGGDDALRREVEDLLRHESAQGAFLEAPLSAPDAAKENPLDGEHPGMVIGSYKLIEQIGEGGMATVWMAQQTAPVKRLVAVKLIKAGMDSKQVLARFEAERQALALMDHPNIARVLDGGTTAAGRPYFVMDLVKGIPITKYCDEHHLTPKERLDLFIPVCQAIQHAHQKGIIHRDLKPTNVLVALYDGNPVPKVIDFGVAKAAGQQLTEKTLVTRFGAIVGTLEYMSPEQASFNQLDVDTRSDVYSLGVLLYELLTGSPPHSQAETEAIGLLEALRAIREQVPTKPSTKLSTAESLPTLAANRGTEPAKLTKLLRGELDWIVMKALEKDRNRRYETVNAFATDLQSYLADEPVQACPPSAGYRLRRFARKNKGAVLTVAAIFLILVAGITGTSLGLVRAENAREAEAEQRMVAEAAVISERKAKEAEAEHRTIAIEAAQKAKREAAVAAAINDFLNRDILQLSSPWGQVNQGLMPDVNLTLRTVLQRAARRIDGKFVNEPEVEMTLRYTIGFALQSAHDNTGALAQYQKVLPYFQQTLGPNNPQTLLAEYRIACMHRVLGHYDLAVQLGEQNLEKHKAALGPTDPQTFVSMNGLATTYWAKGEKEKGLQLHEETLELRKRYLGLDDPDTLVSMNNVAAFSMYLQRLDKALPLFEQTLAGMQKRFGPLHPERLNTTQNLARVYHATEQLDKAFSLQETVMKQFKTAYGLDDSMTQTMIDNLIGYYVDMGWCDKAEALLNSIQSGGANRATNINKQRQEQRERRHRELIQHVRPAADKYQQGLAGKAADHSDTLASRQALAVVLTAQNRSSAAAYHLNAVLDARQRVLGADHPDTQATRLELGTIRLQQKKYAEAEPLLLQAYTGFKQNEDKNPKAVNRSTQTLRNLVKLYEGWDKKDKAEEWRKKLEDPAK